MRDKLLVATTLVFVVLTCPAPLRAQSRNEIGLALGGGTLLVNGNRNASPVGSLAYRLHLTNHVSAEGALDFFAYRFAVGPPDQRSQYDDDYSGAEAAVIYHFRNSREKRTWIPFAALGVGRTTTDFTEIPATTYYRFGAGVAYNFSDRFGTRVEVRDEAIRELSNSGQNVTNLSSVRGALVFRF